MRHVRRIMIPSGKPPVELTPSLFKEVSPEPEMAPSPTGEDMDLYGAMQANEDTGLTDGSTALSEAIAGPSTPPKKAKRSAAKKAQWKPDHFSDGDLISWAKACRQAYDPEGYLKVSALRYWLRYTFHSYTPEYRELGERLEKVVG